MTNFERGYRAVTDQIYAGMVGQEVSEFAARVETSVEELIRDMSKVAQNDKGLHFAKGDVAELWHAGGLNLNAVQRDIDVIAYAPRNASPIDIALRGAHHIEAAQLKYFRSAEDTARAISDPKYATLDKVVPSDQLEGVREAAQRLASHHAMRPEVSASYQHTADVADDRLRIDGAESRPLTEPQSRDLVERLRRDDNFNRDQFELASDDVVRWEDLLREATTAAARAALITAALQAAPYLLTVAKKGIETGEISVEDFVPLGRALPATLLRSSLSGGLTAAIVGAARKEMLGSGLKNIDPTHVSAAVVLCLCAVSNSLRAARGEIAPQEAAASTAEDALTLALALSFSAVGQALIPVPILGSLVGSLVGALVARMIVDEADRAIVGIAASTGWTFFGLVDHDYKVPTELLGAAGWRSVDLAQLQPRALDVRRLTPRALEPLAIDTTVLRRGVVAFRRVGYTA